jgi:hypothetical protein
MGFDERLRHRVGSEGRETWFEIEVEEGLVVAYRVASIDGRPVFVEVRVFGGTVADGTRQVGQWGRPNSDSSREIRRADLADLPVAAHLKRLRALMAPESTKDMAEAQELWSQRHLLSPEFRDLLDPAGTLWAGDTTGQEATEATVRYAEWDVPQLLGFINYLETPPSRAGRKPHDDHYIATIAALYLKSLKRAPRSPYLTLQALMAERRQHLSTGRLEQLVREARKRNLLSGAPGPGKAGGQLTQRGRALIMELVEREGRGHNPLQ